MTNNFLHVDLVVSVTDSGEFERRMTRFLGPDNAFEGLVPGCGFELVLALRTKEAFDYTRNGAYQDRIPAAGSGEKDADALLSSRENVYYNRHLMIHKDGTLEKVYGYVHVWKVPELTTKRLVKMMTACAEDQNYMAIDALVVREHQDLVRGVPGFNFVSGPHGSGRFVRVIRRFDSKDLGRYLFDVGALLPVLEDQSGWRALGQYQNITGSLNTITEFWRAPEETQNNAARIHEVFRGLQREQMRKLGDNTVVNLPALQDQLPYEEPKYFRESLAVAAGHAAE